MKGEAFAGRWVACHHSPRPLYVRMGRTSTRLPHWVRRTLGIASSSLARPKWPCWHHGQMKVIHHQRRPALGAKTLANARIGLVMSALWQASGPFSWLVTGGRPFTSGCAIGTAEHQACELCPLGRGQVRSGLLNLVTEPGRAVFEP